MLTRCMKAYSSLSQRRAYLFFRDSRLTLTLLRQTRRCENVYLDQGHECSDFFVCFFSLFCKYFIIKY